MITGSNFVLDVGDVLQRLTVEGGTFSQGLWFNAAMKRACLLIFLFARAADAQPPDPRYLPAPPSALPGQASQNMHAVTLTATAPRQDLTLSPPPARPTTLTLTIAGIEDPSSQAFSVSASVVWNAASGGAPIEQTLGSVTPYPATQPGSFVLDVPGAARRMLARSDGRLSLRLALQPVAADRPLAEPLRVTLADPAWR